MKIITMLCTGMMLTSVAQANCHGSNPSICGDASQLITARYPEWGTVVQAAPSTLITKSGAGEQIICQNSTGGLGKWTTPMGRGLYFCVTPSEGNCSCTSGNVMCQAGDSVDQNLYQFDNSPPVTYLYMYSPSWSKTARCTLQCEGGWTIINGDGSRAHCQQ